MKNTGGYTGADGDYFTTGNEPANGRMFTTLDNDNDVWNEGTAQLTGRVDGGSTAVLISTQTFSHLIMTILKLHYTSK